MVAIKSLDGVIDGSLSDSASSVVSKMKSSDSSFFIEFSNCCKYPPRLTITRQQGTVEKLVGWNSSYSSSSSFSVNQSINQSIKTIYLNTVKSSVT